MALALAGVGGILGVVIGCICAGISASRPSDAGDDNAPSVNVIDALGEVILVFEEIASTPAPVAPEAIAKPSGTVNPPRHKPS